MSSAQEDIEDQESRFLKARQQRAQQKSSNRDEQALQLAQEFADARKELLTLLDVSGNNHNKILAQFLHPKTTTAGDEEEDAKNNINQRKQAVNAAMAEWRTLQEGVQKVVNQVKLPAFDVQRANSALSKRLQEIELVRSGKEQQQQQQPTASSVTDQSQQQQLEKENGSNKKKTRFRFRRLENYNPDDEEDKNNNNNENSAGVVLATSNNNNEDVQNSSSTKEQQPSSSSVSSNTTTSGDSNNKRENLESNASHMIVANKACFVRHCSDCRIFFAPVNGSIFLANCSNCAVFISGCRQLRMKDCVRCNIFVCCGSTPVIEDSKEIKFGSIEKAWPKIFVSDDDENHQMFKRITSALNCSSVDVMKKRLYESFKAIDDFTWLRSTASPHWKLITDDKDYVELGQKWSDGVEMVSEAEIAKTPESCRKL